MRSRRSLQHNPVCATLFPWWKGSNMLPSKHANFNQPRSYMQPIDSTYGAPRARRIAACWLVTAMRATICLAAQGSSSYDQLTPVWTRRKLAALLEQLVEVANLKGTWKNALYCKCIDAGLDLILSIHVPTSCSKLTYCTSNAGKQMHIWSL